MDLKIGDRAQDFTLLDQNGKSHSLGDFKGKWLLLYFYPKDNTEGCTKEACMLRDDFLGFKKLSVQVIGVSTDSIASHKKFVQEHHLPFTLLSDGNKEVVNLYGVWQEKSMYGSRRENSLQSKNSRLKKYMGIIRTSFLINPDGRIEKIYEKVKPAEHSKEVLEDLKNLIK